MKPCRRWMKEEEKKQMKPCQWGRTHSFGLLLARASGHCKVNWVRLLAQMSWASTTIASEQEGTCWSFPVPANALAGERGQQQEKERHGLLLQSPFWNLE